MSRSSQLTLVVVAIGLLLGVSSGCRWERAFPTAASPPGAGGVGPTLGQSGLGSNPAWRDGFVALDVGDRWHYSGTATKTFIPKVGEPISKHSTWAHELRLTRLELINGREYAREEDSFDGRPPGLPVVRWLRQDRAGLFEVGPLPPIGFLAMPPGADSSTLERTLLAYPLHERATWVLGTIPLVTARVEGHEVLRIPAGRFPAWRIRLRIAGHPASEEVFVWYGAAGYLGFKVHTTSGSPGSNLFIIDDQAEWLDEIDLVRHEPRRALIAEAKDALGAVLTGEQAYYQKFVTYTNAADTLELRVKLGVYLFEPSRNWDFSVSGASATGFVARAEGRDDTEAGGIVVTLTYVRGQPPVWSVERQHNRR